MMKLINKYRLLLPSVFVFMLLCGMMVVTEPPQILLWPNGAPGSKGKAELQKTRITAQGDVVISSVQKPSITPYLPAADKATGAAIVVIPGGGHSEIWISHEGYTPAKWLQEHGIAAFVLKYRLAKDSNSTYTVDKEEMMDVQRAIRLVRSRAKEWGLDTGKVGAVGFSAGGELVALAGMRYTVADPSAADPIDRESDKPDFQGLIYPGNIQRFTVSAASPPAFIAAGYKDRKDISAGAAELYLKYKEANVPAELHIYGNVGHGFGIRATNTGAYSHWPEELLVWLTDMGFVK
jgi:acetyl esterase/lipase